MPEFRPFKGIRPVKEIAGLFSVQYIKYNKSEPELKKELSSNSDSFLNIIEPTWEKDISADKRYQKVRSNFDSKIKENKLTQDKSSYYIYQVVNSNQESIKGLIGLVSIDDYINGKIRKHEETIDNRVKKFAHYLENVHINAEPVLLTYPINHRIGLLMDVEMKRTPIISFKDKQENEHTIWKIENRLNLQQFKKSVENMDALYIADGHNRMESSKDYTVYMREQEAEFIGNEAYNYTMAILISDEELIIRDYNRLVKDLNNLSEEEFLKALKKDFRIIERKNEAFFPSKKHHIGMYLNGNFYGLYIKKENLNTEDLSELDTYLLEKHILKPILNIEDTQNDKRIEFVKGTSNLDGIMNLKERVDSQEFKLAFFFYPVVTKDLQKIADLNLKMPPKSLYIDPKPISGLTIYDLKE